MGSKQLDDKNMANFIGRHLCSLHILVILFFILYTYLHLEHRLRGPPLPLFRKGNHPPTLHVPAVQVPLLLLRDVQLLLQVAQVGHEVAHLGKALAAGATEALKLAVAVVFFKKYNISLIVSICQMVLCLLFRLLA